jgi:hypothetical protein
VEKEMNGVEDFGQVVLACVDLQCVVMDGYPQDTHTVALMLRQGYQAGYLASEDQTLRVSVKVD